MMWLKQLADGVFKVDGVRVANVYLVVTQDGLLLVDTGMPGSARRILRFIERLGWQPGDLRDIVLTHCDIDHVGSVAELRARTGARVAIHELDAPVLSGEHPPQKGGFAMIALYRLLRFRPVAPDLRLRDGDTIGGLKSSTSLGIPRAASPWPATMVWCSEETPCAATNTAPSCRRTRDWRSIPRRRRYPPS
jgi:glyoxylase-like metal-dependent hydrolase (beta-lactamase superfamily II)